MLTPNRTYYPLRSRNREVITLEGSFAPNGAGVVDNTQNQGRGFTVVRNSAGNFTITLAEGYSRLVFADFSVSHAVPAQYSACLGVVAPAANPATITFTVYLAGAATDIAAAATNRIYFELRLQRTGEDP